MASQSQSQGCRVWMPCPHNHNHNHSHHQQHCPHCPLHRHYCHHCPLHNPHFHPNFFQPLPYFTSLPQNPHFSPLTSHPNSGGPVHFTQPTSDAQISQELEHIVDDEDEDDEPIFVLTDEWREFFAKSEARRKQEKQNKKGKKKK